MDNTELRHEHLRAHLCALRQELVLQRECVRPHRWRWLLAQARRLEAWAERHAQQEAGRDERRWVRE